jgi:hypothetical protein
MAARAVGNARARLPITNGRIWALAVRKKSAMNLMSANAAIAKGSQAYSGQRQPSSSWNFIGKNMIMKLMFKLDSFGIL